MNKTQKSRGFSDERETKSEKRERTKRNRAKMVVSGAGLRNILRIKTIKAAVARDQIYESSY